MGNLLLIFNSYSEEFIYVLENYNKSKIEHYTPSQTNKQKQKQKENSFLLFFHPLLYTSHQKLPLFTSDQIIRHLLFGFSYFKLSFIFYSLLTNVILLKILSHTHTKKNISPTGFSLLFCFWSFRNQMSCALTHSGLMQHCCLCHWNVATILSPLSNRGKRLWSIDKDPAQTLFVSTHSFNNPVLGTSVGD